MGRHTLEGVRERERQTNERKKKVPEKGSRVTPRGRDILPRQERRWKIGKEPGL